MSDSKAEMNLQGACYKLLQDFPLYRYRRKKEDGTYELNVLVNGSGDEALALCREILVLGQLLDTQLHVIVLSRRAEEDAADLLRQAPYLGHFVCIRLNGKPVSKALISGTMITGYTCEKFPDESEHAPEEAYLLAKLSFVTADGPNTPLPVGTLQYIVFVYGDRPLEFYDDKGIKHDIVAEKRGDNPALTTDASTTDASTTDTSSDTSRLEKLAFNLHYTYEKSQHPHTTYAAIREAFYGQDYVYTSNMKAALHIRSKLACCGVVETDPKKAAAQYYARITADPELENRLSALENHRWVMDKTLSGYRLMDSITDIYQGNADTHCADADNRWHCCLLPSDPTGKSRLSDDDWSDVDRRWEDWKERGKGWKEAEAEGFFRKAGRDPLDEMSLKVHVRCGELAGETSRRQEVDELLLKIQAYILKLTTVANRGSDTNTDLLDLDQDLECAVNLLWQYERDAVSLYRTAEGKIRERIHDETDAALEKITTDRKDSARVEKAGSAPKASDEETSARLEQALDELSRLLKPVCEYVDRKDYKELDRLFIRQIPFDLTYRPRPTIWKLISGKGMADMFSAWQLEPKQLICLGVTETPMELEQLKDELLRIRGFLGRRGSEVEVRGVAIVMKERWPAKEAFPEQTETDGLSVILSQGVGTENVAAAIREAMSQKPADAAGNVFRTTDSDAAVPAEGVFAKNSQAGVVIPDYVDVTGADPLLMGAVRLVFGGRPVPMFYVRGGKLRSLSDAEELEYPAPAKELSVRDMFEINGADTEGSERALLTDFSQSYEALWNVAAANWGSKVQIDEGDGLDWVKFCRRIAAVFNQDKAKDSGSDKDRNISEDLAVSGQSEAAPEDDFVKRKDVYQALHPSKNHKYTRIKVAIPRIAAKALLPELQKLTQLPANAEDCIVKNLQVDPANGKGNTVTISLGVADNPKDYAGEVRSFIKSCGDKFESGQYFEVRTKNKKTRLYYQDLYVPGIKPKDNMKEQYLDALSSGNLKGGALIRNFHTLENGYYTFRLASREMLSCMQSFGQILEYYVYYSALLKGHFTDVDMGYEYLHTHEAGAAENELDVICTRGMSSLFISCKMTIKKNDDKYLNYIGYEVALQADRFGINAKPVLAAPDYPQFQTDEKGKIIYSSEVRKCGKRGVYLLGDACFRNPDVLGKVLDNIMSGEPQWCDFLKP